MSWWITESWKKSFNTHTEEEESATEEQHNNLVALCIHTYEVSDGWRVTQIALMGLFRGVEGVGDVVVCR